MLDAYLGQPVILDLGSPFVCLGTLTRADDLFLEIENADLHDLRDTKSTRENYIVGALQTGIKRNRKKVLIARSEVLAVTLVSNWALD